MTDAPDLSLAARAGLPETLRALLADHPREGWAAHPEFGPLTRFWLDKHQSFRTLSARLVADARARVDGTLDPQEHAVRLSRLGSHLLSDLHGHHSIEDHHYFPRLAQLHPPLERGFALLDADHHALHEELEAYARDANALLKGGEAGPFAETAARLDAFLDRHLWDEEEVVVPILLSVGEGAVGH